METKTLNLLKGVKGAVDKLQAALNAAKASGIEIDPSLLDQAGGALQVAIEEAEAKPKVSEDSVEPKTGEKKTLPEPAACKVRKADTTTPPVPLPEGEEEDEEDDEEDEEAAAVENEELAPESSTVPMTEPSTTTPAIKMAKREGPMATNPPVASNLILHSDIDTELPNFMAAMESGDLGLAKKLSGFRYDEFMNKSQRALLDQGGWRYEDINKFSRLPILSGRTGDPSLLQKSIELADLPGVYLMRLARLMLPMYAGLRRRLPSSTPPVGSNYAQWRAQLGMASFDYAAAMAVSEMATGTAIDEDFLLFAAPFMRSAVTDKVSLEAIYGSNGYDDPLQVAVIRALTTLLVIEEKKLLGDVSAALGPVSGTPTAVAAGSGTMGGANAKFVITALSYKGYLGTVRGKTAGADVAGSGETDGTLSAEVNLSGALTCTVSWTPVPGAVAYNIYYAVAGTKATAVWVAYTTKTSYSVTSAEVAAATAYVCPAADQTANAKGYEGLISWAERSTVYGKTIPSKTFINQNGAALTNYAGGIEEFDTLLRALWTNWQVAPSLIVCSPQGAQHVTKQLLATANPGLYRFEVSQERGTLSGGVFVSGYVNKFATWADGAPRIIDLIAHPYMPAGKFLFLTESIPYPMAREARGFAVDVLIPYTYFPLAQSDISYPFSMLVSETVECFHPSAQASIVGVNDA